MSHNQGPSRHQRCRGASRPLCTWRWPATRPQRCLIRTDRHGTEVTLRVFGIIDQGMLRRWDQCASDLLDGRPTSVTLDLAGVTRVASWGVRLIVDLRQQLRTAAIPSSIVNVPPAFARLIALAA